MGAALQVPKCTCTNKRGELGGNTKDWMRGDVLWARYRWGVSIFFADQVVITNGVFEVSPFEESDGVEADVQKDHEIFA